MREEVTAIVNVLKTKFQYVNQIRVFVFGSAPCPDTIPNDIDLVIIYDEPIHPEEIRKLLASLDYMPIHPIFLTIQEEMETNFITSQRCISIL